MVGSPAIGPDPVGAILNHRGFKIERRGDNRNILLPLDSATPLTGEQFNRFHHLFGNTTFPKLVRHITAHSGDVPLAELKGISGEYAEQYVDFLLELGVACLSDGRVKLTRSIDNIGPTLEWYVASLCQREFDGSSEWGVKLADLQYGDYDVLAWLPPTLVYIETKSSQPSGISNNELKHFLQRGVELVPDLAILLVDTDDDLEEAGLLDRLFEVMLPTARSSSGIDDPEWRNNGRLFIAPQPSFPGVSFGYYRNYVTNSLTL